MGDALDITEASTLTAMADSDGDTQLTSTGSTTTAVGVALYIVGQTIVDDVRQVIDIQTTSSHVGSDEEL